MLTTPLTLDALRRRRAEILTLAGQRRPTRVQVFGSVARGDAGSRSDVDLLVDFEPEASLLDQVGLFHDLEVLLGVPVDVVSSGGLRRGDTAIGATAIEL